MLRLQRRSTGWFATSVLVALVLALAGSARAPASTSILPPGSIAPTERQRMVARRIGAILEETHYRRVTIDDKMVEKHRMMGEARRYYGRACKLGAEEDWRKAYQRAEQNLQLTGGMKHDAPSRAKPADHAPVTPNRAKA